MWSVDAEVWRVPEPGRSPAAANRHEALKDRKSG
jgi:hypothetical protein